MGEQRVRRELKETAAGLLLLNLSSSEAEIQSLIDDGFFHLEELRQKQPCNAVQISSMEQRIDGAKFLLQQKANQKKGLFEFEERRRRAMREVLR